MTACRPVFAYLPAPIRSTDGLSDGARRLLNTPLRIGGRMIQKRLILSPMSGLTHVAFRELLSEFGGCGLLFTEMCSAGAIPHENPRVSSVFRWRDTELDMLVCQIVGSEPAVMAAAARRIEAEGFFGVDLNFGCSVGAICRKNCGAALLKTPDRAVEIVTRIRKAVSTPVFVKFRTGWEDQPEPAVDLARRFEDAGADALVFHPRVAPDRRTRPPKWDHIAGIKKAVAIPVFANGDVFTEADLERIMRVSGCDGVSLGRIAVAMPWVFSQWSSGAAPEPDMFRRMLLRHVELLHHHFDAVIALRKFRQAALYPAAMFQYGHVFYKKLRNAGDRETLTAAIHDFFDAAPRPMDRPNMNLFR
jgi:tRNA-dihydrouridine synthase B